MYRCIHLRVHHTNRVPFCEPRHPQRVIYSREGRLSAGGTGSGSSIEPSKRGQRIVIKVNACQIARVVSLYEIYSRYIVVYVYNTELRRSVDIHVDGYY